MRKIIFGILILILVSCSGNCHKGKPKSGSENQNGPPPLIFCKNIKGDFFYTSGGDSFQISKVPEGPPQNLKVSIKNDEYLSDIDVGKLSPDRELYNFSNLEFQKTSATDPSIPKKERATYETRIFWDQKYQPFRLILLFNCLDEQILNNKLASTENSNFIDLPAECLKLDPTAMTTNRSQFKKIGKKESYQIAIDIQYTYEEVPWNFKGNLTVSQTEGILNLNNYHCTIDCQDENGECQYECENGAKGKLHKTPGTDKLTIPTTALTSCAKQGEFFQKFAPALEIDKHP